MTVRELLTSLAQTMPQDERPAPSVSRTIRAK
jgi:hypothetical protein